MYERSRICAAYYYKFLDKNDFYRRKRHDQHIRDAISELTKMQCPTLSHPPYSPDISLCDFHLFGPFKEAVEGGDSKIMLVKKMFMRIWLLI